MAPQEWSGQLSIVHAAPSPEGVKIGAAADEDGKDGERDSLLQKLQQQGSIIEALEKRLLTVELQQAMPQNARRAASTLGATPGSCDTSPRNQRASPLRTSSSRTLAAARMHDRTERRFSETRLPSSLSEASPSRNTTKTSMGPFREPDPFKGMWAKSRFDEERQMFEKSQLQSIHNKADQSCRNRGARWGTGIAGLLAMPFGPIGILGGGVFGALVGALVGHFFDVRRRRTKAADLELNTRKLRSLVRWASDASHKDEDILKLIEMVTLEFKPMADVASGSDSACKMLRLLDKWISQTRVTRQLWIYMNSVLRDWRVMSRSEFVRAMLVFQTLRTMYSLVHKVFSDQELQFLQRMDRLLEHQAVKSVMSHSQMYSNQNEQHLAEVMVYADRAAEARHSARRFTSPRKGPKEAFKDAAKDADNNSAGRADASPCATAGELPVVNQSTTDRELGLEDQDEDFLQDFRHSIDDGPGASHASSPSTGRSARRFFKDWDDFMQFDINVKHKMPITSSEFDLLLHKESESCQGWDVAVDRQEIKVAKTLMGTGLITIRAWGTVPGVDINVAFHLFYKTEERMKWDKVFAQMHVVEENIQGSEVLYSLFRVPAMTPREFLQFRRVRQEKDGSILIVLRSAEHPDCPEDRNNIRAESHISGYVLRQEWEDSTPVLKVFLMSCVDIKGLVPKWLINHVAPRKPSEWVENLRKAALEYQEANPDYAKTLSQSASASSCLAVENPFDFEQEDDANAGVDLPEGALAPTRGPAEDMVCSFQEQDYAFPLPPHQRLQL